MIRFSIGRKLAVGFGILMSFFILLGFVSYFQMQTVIKDIIKITDQEEPKSAAAYEMAIHAIETEINILNYLFSPTRQFRNNMDQIDQSFSKAYDEYLKLAKNPEEKQLSQLIRFIRN